MQRLRAAPPLAAMSNAQQRANGRPRAPAAQPLTHFIGLRVTSPHVSDVFARAHQALLAVHAEYASTLVPPAAAHVTLCVCRLPDEDAVAHALRALSTVSAAAPRPHIAGCGAFGTRVLFLELAHDGERRAVCELAATVRAALAAAGVPLQPERGAFTPHITLAKARRGTAPGLTA